MISPYTMKYLPFHQQMNCYTAPHMNGYSCLGLRMMDIRMRIDIHQRIPVNISVRTNVREFSATEPAAVLILISTGTSACFRLMIKI
jgi:hypothetical protein